MSGRRYRHRKNYNLPGHAHELTFSCYQKFQFLKVEKTCRWLSEAIGEARIEFDFDLWAFVFMPEHAHLIIRPRPAEYDIGRIRTAIKEPVGRKAIKHLEREAPHWLPKVTRSRGKRVERCFWMSGGGYDRNITEPATLAKMIDYVHRNPIRRGLVEKAVGWKWSSAGWFEESTTCPLIPDRIPPEWTV